MKNVSILVVEDEAALNRLISRVLTAASYTVHSATTAAEANKILAEQKIDFLFTDLTLPDQDGAILAAETQQQRPEITVAASSGGGRPGRLAESIPFLAKPFSPQELLGFLKPLHSGE